jgi:hypothetical protein
LPQNEKLAHSDKVSVPGAKRAFSDGVADLANSLWFPGHRMKRGLVTLVSQQNVKNEKPEGNRCDENHCLNCSPKSAMIQLEKTKCRRRLSLKVLDIQSVSY